MYCLAPLDILAVRKVGAPLNPEFAVGAVSEDGEVILNKTTIAQLSLNEEAISKVARNEMIEIQRQVQCFRKGKAPVDVLGKTVILVDDGLATGATAWAAARFLKKKGAASICLAIPVAAHETAQRLRTKVDEVVALQEPLDFLAVGYWYENFSPVTDEEVIKALQDNEKEFKGPLGRSLAKESVEAQALRSVDSLEGDILKQMIPIRSDEDLKDLIATVKDKRVVMLGEATHGTAEFYDLRRRISQILIKDYGFKFVAVEGDWPDAYRLNQYIRHNEGSSSKQVLKQNHRWPTWMWANDEIVKLAEWMKINKGEFFGLDVYSLFESIDAVLKYTHKIDPKLSRKLAVRYSCLEPYQNDEIAYAKSLFLFPEGCEKQVLENLQEISRARLNKLAKNSELFSAEQNARIAANAEAYYRAMLTGDASSWNVRDSHMMDTLDRLLDRAGEGAKAIVWAHNTHIGDYRATDMVHAGYVNIGGLARESYGEENVALVGFGTYQGEVLAGRAWGAPEEVMPLPPAHDGSYEAIMHRAALEKKSPQFCLLFDEERYAKSFREVKGHRAVGVVYQPQHEGRGQYVPTSLSKRYDAFIFIDNTTALNSLHSAYTYGEIPETWPIGQ